MGAPKNNNLSARDIEVAALAWRCLKSEPQIDYKKLAELGGFKNQNSAAACWGPIKQKLMANAPAAGGNNSSGPPKDAGRIRKRKASDDGGDDEETTPKSSPKKKKAAAANVKKQAAAANVKKQVSVFDDGDEEVDTKVKKEAKDEDAGEGDGGIGDADGGPVSSSLPYTYLDHFDPDEEY